MSTKPVFVDYQTKICSNFLNPTADAVWDALGEPKTPTEARTNIGAVEEAPSTGEPYGRQDANWVVVPALGHTHTDLYEPVDPTLLRQFDVDDTPVDGVITAPISSNWAYDHVAAADPHSGYALESALGAAAYLPVGTIAGTVAAGDDARFNFSLASHATTHKAGGTDIIKLDELAAPTDIITLNASATAHGLLPKLNNNIDTFLRGDGVWTGPIDTGKNRLINSRFKVNQRGVTGTITLSANQYGHDRWKAGASGCTYSVALVPSVNHVTITAGSLSQVIEAVNMSHVVTPFTVSWYGTAQCNLHGSGFGPSPRTVSLPADAHITVEFGTGTLSLPQLEIGSDATPYSSMIHQEEELSCKRYYNMIGGWTANDIYIASYALGAGNYAGGTPFVFPIQMRVAPTITSPANWTVTNCGQPTLTGISVVGFSMFLVASGAGACLCGSTVGFAGAHWNCNAEI